MRSKVHVSVRARPTGNFASDIMTFNESANYIKLMLPKEDSGHVNGPQSEDDKFNKLEFKVNKVMQSASQEQVFDTCAKDIVRSVMKGYNGTILAYGQTGAGKTHTMTGGHVGFEDRGIVPRAIAQVYQEKENLEGRNITIRLSYVEIYNELMFDLLTDTGVAEQSGDLIIAEEKKKDGREEIKVKGLSMPVAGTNEEALHIFFQGDTNRHVAEHALNKGSTRSHCVFTVHIESRARHDCNDKGFNSKLHLVDLAGSERVKKTGTDGVTLKEASYINKSLSFLEQVVKALGESGRGHIPYRQSKLTHLLKDSLGGNCKTAMIANIWPEAKMLEETISTLRFAQRMQKVYNDPIMNEHTDPSTLLVKYERQIKELKQELAMHNTLANRGHVQYDTYSPEEERDLDDKVQKYLDGELFELEVESVRMSLESFKLFRKKYQDLQKDLAKKEDQLQRGGYAAGAEKTGADEAAAGEGGEEQFTGDGVGESEERGISVGIAPSASRPMQDQNAPDADALGMSGTDNDQTRVGGMVQRGAANEGERPPDRQGAFADWKSREGQSFEDAFEKNRQELKSKREDMRVALNAANAAKRDIDEAKERLARKQADKAMDNGKDEELIDEEEYALIKSLKETKHAYREAFEKHRGLKADVDQINQNMRVCKQRLIQAFDAWYEQRYSHAARGAETVGEVDPGERYDPQELFDLMEADRLETHDPDKLAYTMARKYADRAVRQKKTHSVGAGTRRR